MRCRRPVAPFKSRQSKPCPDAATCAVEHRRPQLRTTGLEETWGRSTPVWRGGNHRGSSCAALWCFLWSEGQLAGPARRRDSFLQLLLCFLCPDCLSLASAVSPLLTPGATFPQFALRPGQRGEGQKRRASRRAAFATPWKGEGGVVESWT